MDISKKRTIHISLSFDVYSSLIKYCEDNYYSMNKLVNGLIKKELLINELSLRKELEELDKNRSN